MRNELLQERTARQDLECDKISLERQVQSVASFVLEFSFGVVVSVTAKNWAPILLISICIVLSRVQSASCELSYYPCNIPLKEDIIPILQLGK